MSSRDAGRRLLRKDERVLWTAFTRTIAPLRDPLADDAAAHDTDRFTDESGADVRVAPPAHPLPAPAPAPAKSPPSLTPLGRRLRQRVARGKEAIDGRLDLHGLTQSEAHARLLHFLRTASARQARLVLVITGKGSRNGEGARGVLKRQVPHWLGQSEFRTFVIGFEDAHAAHGGEGALYVRIRRTRE
jgi:DNA-nicking Smr family endonuclease